jgi:hypothetical protein
MIATFAASLYWWSPICLCPKIPLKNTGQERSCKWYNMPNIIQQTQWVPEAWIRSIFPTRCLLQAQNVHFMVPKCVWAFPSFLRKFGLGQRQTGKQRSRQYLLLYCAQQQQYASMMLWYNTPNLTQQSQWIPAWKYQIWRLPLNVCHWMS